MEVAGVVFRQAPCFSSSAGNASNVRHLTTKLSKSFCPKQPPNRKSVQFSDQSHLQYYNGPMMAIKEKETVPKKKEMKKKLKLLKGLSRNLSTFSEMGFGLNPDNGLDHQVKGQMISEATEVLLGQLQKLKAEELERKMKKKEEKNAARMKMKMDGMESSSSESSSCSSESECEKVMTTSQLKTRETPIVDEEATPSSLSSSLPIAVGGEKRANCDDGSKRIEVCMGGKCKKSGGAMLLENLAAAVGEGAAVVGCKCMGKCRDGPNVRVGSNGNGPLSLCIGVGPEDVDSIVTNFFGRSQLPALSGL